MLQPVGRNGLCRAILLGALAFGVGACAGAGRTANQRPAVPEVSSGVPAGYLSNDEIPDSAALLPAPPAGGSAAFAQDEAVSVEARALRNSPRWQQAVEDANLDFPRAAGTYACALNMDVNEKDTPHLYILLRRTQQDARRATTGAKNKYARTRPFVVFNEPTCSPDDEALLRNNGSYPSGHTSAGWTWALILAELAPERSDAILARGRSFGESRLVCNVHWQSDVLAGRFMASGLVARLHANDAFQADMAAARAEVSAAHARNLKPTRDCAAEAAALARKVTSAM